MSTYNICLYIEVDKKYIRWNLKTFELLHCALKGACAVIRSNTVITYSFPKPCQVTVYTLNTRTQLLSILTILFLKIEAPFRKQA